MANTITDIMPKILARALLVLRERAVMPRLVNGDYSTEAAQKGSTIDVPIPSAKSATDVTPASVPPTPGSTAISTVQVSLDTWKKVNFFLTDDDIQKIDRDDVFLPTELSEAARGLANAINASIFALYPGVYSVYGDAGTTPFSSTPGVTSITGLRKVLNQTVCPRDNRRLVLDFAAEADALALPAFSDAEKIQSALVKLEGEIGRKFGFDIVADDAVPTHTRNAVGAGAMTVNGAHSADATSLSIAKAAGANWSAVVGDVITIAGEASGLDSYVITADVTVVQGTNTSVAIQPGLRLSKSGGETITSIDTHVVNLGFHRDAIAFAMRPLVSSTVDLQLGNQILALQDPVTGLTIRLEISRQYKQTMWELDALWGCKLVRPQLIARLLG
jgi:hypothetical protein